MAALPPAAPDSILCPQPGCWHPINNHIIDKGGCRTRWNGGQTLCQCKRTPNDVAAAVLIHDGIECLACLVEDSPTALFHTHGRDS